MSKILIITDTSSDIPVELLEHDDIEIIPMIFTINGKPFSEDIDFTQENFYEILPKRDCVTSFQIPAAVYIDRFAHAQAHGYTDVLIITSDSKISPMYSSAVEGREMFLDNNPDTSLNIHIVDSLTYTMGTGLLVLRAAKLVKEGKDIDYIVKEIYDMSRSVELIVNSFSIKYLQADDPIEWVKKITSEITHPFPTFSIVESEPIELPIVKGDHTAFDQFYAYCKESLIEKKPSYAIGYAVREKEAIATAMLLEKELGYPPISIYKIGAFSSYCAGTASITLAFFGINRAEQVDED